MLRLMQQGVTLGRAERVASRTRAAKEWKRLLGRCRKTPERPFLELVGDRDFYRGLVESR